MDMNKPTLIATVVLVFVVGLVFGSFSGLTSITTGQASRTDVTTASVQLTGSGSALPGERVSGRVIPGANGAEKYVYIYSIGDQGQLQVRKENCNSCFCAHNNICYETEEFSWQVPSDYSPGRYVFLVTDAKTLQKVYSQPFTVGYEKPKGIS